MFNEPVVVIQAHRKGASPSLQRRTPAPGLVFGRLALGFPVSCTSAPCVISRRALAPGSLQCACELPTNTREPGASALRLMREPGASALRLMREPGASALRLMIV